MECMLGLMKQNVFLLLFAPTKGAHLLIATLGGYKGGTNAVTEIELGAPCPIGTPIKKKCILKLN